MRGLLLRQRPCRALCPLCAMLVFGPASPGTPVLSTSDTTLAVEAGALAPRLVTLGRRNGWLLKNLSAAALPDRVEIGGAMQPLEWRLDPAASHHDPKEIALAYVSDAPAPGLVWRG